mgnify:CR=1 FL=1
MAKAVFTTKVEPAYDDLPEYRYHFPRTYLRQAEEAVGDWVVYYEPRRPNTDPNSRGGRQVYFGTARLSSIEADPGKTDHFYAFMSDYLEFERPVPFKEGALYFESSLKKADGSTNKGAFGRSVRTMTDEDYDLILRAGFSEIIGSSNAHEQAHKGLAEDQLEFERPIVERLIARPFRDAAFSKIVRSAYEETCAFTGLKIINGGGRPEVQAAHIRPVADSGSDSIRNGLALSGTIHWMFDRGLISVDEDLTILKADNSMPDTINSLLNSDGMLRIPIQPDMCPHPRHLEYHRENIFKG